MGATHVPGDLHRVWIVFLQRGGKIVGEFLIWMWCQCHIYSLERRLLQLCLCLYVINTRPWHEFASSSGKTESRWGFLVLSLFSLLHCSSKSSLIHKVSVILTAKQCSLILIHSCFLKIPSLLGIGLSVTRYWFFKVELML